MSGHIYFADRYFGFDDALYAALRLAELVAAADRPLGALVDALPTYYATPEIRVDCPDAVKFAVVAAVKAHFAPTHEIIAVDGARIVYEDGWALVRASNTQPALVLRAEATTERRRDEILAEIQGVVAKLAAV